MTIRKVDKDTSEYAILKRLAENRRHRFELEMMLEEFVNLDEPFVEVDTSGYKKINSAQTGICAAIKRRKFPVFTKKIDGKLFIIKKDM